ncbi:MAG: STAS domain-containing protein [Oligoflexia bacterium]|nr:STAS domain-containing protein [Oligoflexia bacterium]
MEVPILKQGEYLIASVQVALSDQDLLALQQRLSALTGTQEVRGVVIDVTVLDVLDSYAVRILRMISEVLALRGARTIIAGIQPEVALAMVRLGLGLEGVETALDLEDAMEKIARRGKSRSPEGRSTWPPLSRNT